MSARPITRYVVPAEDAESLLCCVEVPHDGDLSPNVHLDDHPALGLSGPALVLDAERQGDLVLLSVVHFSPTASPPDSPAPLEAPMPTSDPLTVVLDRQHVGKPHNPRDLGAWGDLDHDGHADLDEHEGLWTAQYLFPAERRLRALGHRVIPMSDGRYSERHDRANRYGADVHIAAHLNSLTGGTRTGGGNYASIFYDHRSRPESGRALGRALRDALSAACPELATVKLFPAKPGDWTSRAYSTISGLQAPVGICFEPAFIDHADHRPLFTAEGMGRIGAALADGIHAWHQNRRNA